MSDAKFPDELTYQKSIEANLKILKAIDEILFMEKMNLLRLVRFKLRWWRQFIFGYERVRYADRESRRIVFERWLAEEPKQEGMHSVK